MTLSMAVLLSQAVHFVLSSNLHMHVITHGMIAVLGKPGESAVA